MRSLVLGLGLVLAACSGEHPGDSGALDFDAAKQLEGGGEANLSLRVNDLDTGTPTFTGRYAELKGGTEEDVDCGAYLRQ